MVGDRSWQRPDVECVAGADLTTPGPAVPAHRSRRPARSLVTNFRRHGGVVALCSVAAVAALAGAPAAVSPAAATRTMPAHTVPYGPRRGVFLTLGRHRLRDRLRPGHRVGQPRLLPDQHDW